MQNQDYLSKIKKLERRFYTITAVLLLIVISSAFLVSGISFKQVALALTGDYSKQEGDVLSSEDWNDLTEDFATKDELNSYTQRLDGFVTGSELNNYINKNENFNIVTHSFSTFSNSNTVSQAIKNYKFCALSYVDDDTSDGSCGVAFNDATREWSVSVGVDSGGHQACRVVCFNW